MVGPVLGVNKTGDENDSGFLMENWIIEKVERRTGNSRSSKETCNFKYLGTK